MNIKVISINFRYDHENNVDMVSVRFDANNQDNTLTCHGHVEITETEYQNNKELEDLATLVKQRLSSEFA